jgi:hypothetical protein
MMIVGGPQAEDLDLEDGCLRSRKIRLELGWEEQQRSSDAT